MLSRVDLSLDCKSQQKTVFTISDFSSSDEDFLSHHKRQTLSTTRFDNQLEGLQPR